jgi:hypothetical protein
LDHRSPAAAVAVAADNRGIKFSADANGPSREHEHEDQGTWSFEMIRWPFLC